MTDQNTDVLLERALAQFIDGIAAAFLGLIPIAIFLIIGIGLSSYSEPLATATILVGFLTMILSIIAYEPVLEYRWKGQTIGKRILKIKVVTEEGEEIGAEEAVIRNIPALGFVIPYFGLVAYPTALLSIYESEERQRLFDRAADTVVVEE